MSDAAASALYPACEPYAQGFLPSLQGHQVYFEQTGNPQGLPVLFLHGGPGSGCTPQHRQLFNPASTRAVLFDQRGCGRSLAQQPLQANTTLDLIGDIERLRLHLGISSWLVVGGSWGGGLALAYARVQAQACLGLVLRGVFLSRPGDLRWFFQDAAQCMPDAWSALAQAVPAANREDIGAYLFAQLPAAPDHAALPLAQAWQDWENALMQRQFTPRPTAQPSSSKAPNPTATAGLLAKYRLQSHYLAQGCFFPSEGLLQHVSHLPAMPVHLLHGRLDWICRPESAWALHQVLPHSRLQWVDQAGHSLSEPAMSKAMVAAIDAMVTQLKRT